MQTRRDFLKTSLLGAGGLMIGGVGLDSKLYAASKGANDKIKVGIIGFPTGPAPLSSLASRLTPRN